MTTLLIADRHQIVVLGAQGRGWLLLEGLAFGVLKVQVLGLGGGHLGLRAIVADFLLLATGVCIVGIGIIKLVHFQ